MNNLDLLNGFLKTWRIKTRYWENVQNKKAMEDFLVHGKYSDITNTNMHEVFISVRDAFDWEKTLEGFDFWSDISNKWEDFIKVMVIDKI